MCRYHQCSQFVLAKLFRKCSFTMQPFKVSISLQFCLIIFVDTKPMKKRGENPITSNLFSFIPGKRFHGGIIVNWARKWKIPPNSCLRLKKQKTSGGRRGNTFIRMSTVWKFIQMAILFEFSIITSRGQFFFHSPVYSKTCTSELLLL